MFSRQNIKDVLTLALPAVGEMILYMMIWVFDTMMVGKYGGNTAVSTVGLSSEVMYTFTSVFIAVGVTVGITSLVARRLGAGETDLAEEYASLGLAAGVFIALVISLITFNFSKNILTVAGAAGDVISQGTMFMRITSFGIFFNMLMNLMNGILRGYGNTKTPLLVSVIINIINLGLDWILIFGRYGFPELGVRGSAVATASAQTMGFLFISLYVLKKSKIKPRIKYIKNLELHKLFELLRLSIPSSLQEAALDVSRLISAFIIMRLGTVAFASNQIATTIESLSFMPGWGFAVAATTLVGHKIGEKNYKKANEYAYVCMALGVISMSICSLLFLCFPDFLIRLFIKESERSVIYLGGLCIMVASIEQPPMAVSMIIGGALKGCGDTRTPFKVSLMSGWLIRLPLMFYFIYILKLSVVYVWFITAIQWLFDGTLVFILFRKSQARLL